MARSSLSPDLFKVRRELQNRFGITNGDEKTRRKTFEKSSGKVFADIGLANPEREQLGAHLTLQIYRIIKSRGLTQVEAGAILGIKQPHVEALMHNHFGNFQSNDQWTF